jgi:two-component system sensor histidine kinase KdpD
METGHAEAEFGEPGRSRTLPAYLWAVTAVTAATAVAWLMSPWFAVSDLIMVYLLGVVLVAMRHGRAPSLLASLLSVGAFNFFFVPPHFTFAVAEIRYAITFLVMFVVAVAIGGLTARMRAQAEGARQRERHMAALYAMSRDLASARGVEGITKIAARHVGDLFESEVVVLLPSAAGEQDGAGLYLPLQASRGTIGVIGIKAGNGRSVDGQRRDLEPFVDQIALAIERAQLADEAEAARIRVEAERLRSTLLSSVSHDLRTPLATITGAASTLLESGEHLDAGTRHELLECVHEEAERLGRLVQNLLQMTRIESGPLQLRAEWHSIEEVIGAALARVEKRLGRRQVDTDVPPELPLVPIDDVLIEQVLVNLLENAIKYTPPGSPLVVTAAASDQAMRVEVADRGPGLPPGEEEQIFAKFYRGRGSPGRSSGLGLAICEGIVRAHGGRIWAQTRAEGGSAFSFTLPLGGTPPVVVRDD